MVSSRLVGGMVWEVLWRRHRCLAMDQAGLFAAALELHSPWRVVGVGFDEKKGQLRLQIDFERGARFACPTGGVICAVHDTVPRQQRYPGRNQQPNPSGESQGPRLRQPEHHDHHGLPHRRKTALPPTHLKQRRTKNHHAFRAQTRQVAFDGPEFGMERRRCQGIGFFVAVGRLLSLHAGLQPFRSRSLLGAS